MTGNTFRFLGVPAALGRTLAPADAQPGAPPVFVMSHKMWMKHWNGDPAILGRSFVLNGVSTSLVGIMPPASPRWRPTCTARSSSTAPIPSSAGATSCCRPA